MEQILRHVQDVMVKGIIREEVRSFFGSMLDLIRVPT